MAHKTFSQEQFSFIFYRVVVLFSVSCVGTSKNNYNGGGIKKKMTTLLVPLILKYRNLDFYKNLSTNFLFIKKYKFYCFCRDSNYFKLY